MTALRTRIVLLFTGVLWLLMFSKSLYGIWPNALWGIIAAILLSMGYLMASAETRDDTISFASRSIAWNIILGVTLVGFLAPSLSTNEVLTGLMIIVLVLLLSILIITSMRLEIEKGEETHARLNQRTEQLLYLQQVGMAMNSSDEIASFIYVVLMATSNITGAKRLALLTRDSGNEELTCHSGLGIDGMDDKIGAICQSDFIHGILDSGKSLLFPLNKLHHDAVTVSEEEIEKFCLVPGSSVMALPLVRKDGCWGVFYTEKEHDEESEPFSMDDHEVLRVLASQISVALENADLYFKTKESYRSTVEALAAAIDAKDKYTSGHSTAVSRYAVPVAREMLMGEDELEQIEFAALLHDVGKIAVPAAVLNKPGKLSKEEFEQIKVHPAAGAEIIKSVTFLKDAVGAVKHHHERWDGKGYPDGLKGDDIPVCAQIVGIVDTFDAMTSTRSYRKALSEEEAIKEIQRCAGSQFNPAVVEAFIQAYNNGFIKINENRSAYEFSGSKSFLVESDDEANPDCADETMVAESGEK